jgi:hypothetical protein
LQVDEEITAEVFALLWEKGHEISFST